MLLVNHLNELIEMHFMYLELTSLRKKYDLRSILQWREHVEQTRGKVR